MSGDPRAIPTPFLSVQRRPGPPSTPPRPSPPLRDRSSMDEGGCPPSPVPVKSISTSGTVKPLPSIPVTSPTQSPGGRPLPPPQSLKPIPPSPPSRPSFQGEGTFRGSQSTPNLRTRTRPKPPPRTPAPRHMKDAEEKMVSASSTISMSLSPRNRNRPPHPRSNPASPRRKKTSPHGKERSPHSRLSPERRFSSSTPLTPVPRGPGGTAVPPSRSKYDHLPGRRVKSMRFQPLPFEDVVEEDDEDEEGGDILVTHSAPEESPPSKRDSARRAKSMRFSSSLTPLTESVIEEERLRMVEENSQIPQGKRIKFSRSKSSKSPRVKARRVKSQQLLRNFRKSGQLADPHRGRSASPVGPPRHSPVILFVGGSSCGKVSLAERLFHNTFLHPSNRIRKLEQSVKLNFPELSPAPSPLASPSSPPDSPPFPSSTPLMTISSANEGPIETTQSAPARPTPPQLQIRPPIFRAGSLPSLHSQSPPSSLSLASEFPLTVPPSRSGLSQSARGARRVILPPSLQQQQFQGSASAPVVPSPPVTSPSVARIDFLESEPTLREALTRGVSSKKIMLLLYVVSDLESIALLEEFASALEVSPDTPALLVRTMVDRPEDARAINSLAHTSLIPEPEVAQLCDLYNCGHVAVSARSGSGIDTLRSQLVDFIRSINL